MVRLSINTIINTSNPFWRVLNKTIKQMKTKKTEKELIKIIQKQINNLKTIHKMKTTKQKLTDLILELSSKDYEAFKDNYNIEGERGLLQFLFCLNEETQQEVINEINFNTNYKY